MDCGTNRTSNDKGASLERLFSAFQSGLQVPAAKDEALSAWIDVLSRHALARVARVELNIAARCKILSDKARNAAEHQNQTEACRLLAIATVISQSPSLSTEARYLCIAEIAPAELYVERILGNVEGARSYLVKALEMDECLEDVYGYHWKIAHRVHLLTVAVALCAHQGLLNEAAERTAQILGLLAGNNVTIGEPGAWHSSRLACLSEGMRYVLAMQALRVIFPVLAGCYDEERMSLLFTFAKALGKFHKNENRLPSICGLFGPPVADYLKALWYAAYDTDEYLQESTVLVGLGGFKSLTFSLAFDAACYCMERYGTQNRLAYEVLHLGNNRPWLLSVRRHWQRRFTKAVNFTRDIGHTEVVIPSAEVEMDQSSSNQLHHHQL